MKKTIERAVANYYSSLTLKEPDELAAWGDFALSEFPDNDLRVPQIN
jgi:hypothetical protein